MVVTVGLWCISILALVFAVVALAIAVDNSKRIDRHSEINEKLFKQNYKFHQTVVDSFKDQNEINNQIINQLEFIVKYLNNEQNIGSTDA